MGGTYVLNLGDMNFTWEGGREGYCYHHQLKTRGKTLYIYIYISHSK